MCELWCAKDGLGLQQQQNRLLTETWDKNRKIVTFNVEYTSFISNDCNIISNVETFTVIVIYYNSTYQALSCIL